jgi:glutamine---fructose-6-phosphate transaminase (isomerizing)
MSTSAATTLTDSATYGEIVSQPRLWAAMLDRGPADAKTLLGEGRALALGCGTSAFVAQAVAALREESGLGETDWCYASETPHRRSYDHVIAITRSATTTEVLGALRQLPVTGTRVAVVGATGPITAPLASLVDSVVTLDDADETSVVQTRFPTSLLTLVRAGLGACPADLVAHGEMALTEPLPDLAAISHFVYLGSGWTVGLAHEAALKVREMAQAWSESYPAMDYRHGPIAVAGAHTLAMIFGEPPAGLADELRATGATVITSDLDPLAQLVIAQRVALTAAVLKGLDPDRPHRLTRSVVFDAEIHQGGNP